MAMLADAFTELLVTPALIPQASAIGAAMLMGN
jgi:hypothetical protein